MSTSIAVDPALANSRRVKLLAKHPLIRSAARQLVHRFPSLWPNVSGAYAGPVEFHIEGIRIKYILGPSDAIGEVMYWRGESHWEREVIPRFAELATNAEGLMLDLGANFGLYGLLACNANPRVQVISWEPVPFVYERQKLNVSANGLDGRMHCRMAALSSASGEAVFHVHSDAAMGSLTKHPGSTGSIRVRLETVDDTVPPDAYVGLVKIDVEGHELEALQGMRRILHEQKPPIIFECLTSDAWTSLSAFLQGFGYRITQLGGDKSVNYLATAK